jgi:hypothetical protein
MMTMRQQRRNATFRPDIVCWITRGARSQSRLPLHEPTGGNIAVDSRNVTLKQRGTSMTYGLRWRFYVETGAGVITTALFLATLLYPDWIEALFRIDPDNASGWLERLVVGGLLVMTIALLSLARREWRKTIAIA